MIQLTFSGTDQKLIERLSRVQDSLYVALIRRMNILMAKLQQRIQQKLSGEVLQSRSGKLKASIVAQPAALVDGNIVGSVTGAGGPAWYGIVHEHGGQGWYDIYPKNKKALAFFPSGAGAFALNSSGARVSAKQIVAMMRNPKTSMRGKTLFGEAGGVVVRHVHHPPLPQRQFMGNTLDEMTPAIVAGLQEAADEVMRNA